ncbi:MAG: F0F1 ATP synthase subunit B [Chloroflexota bacterium]
MLELNATTVILQIINFVVLLWVLGKLVFKPLMSKISARGQVIGETLQGARDQEAAAAHLKREWEERMRQVENQAEDIIQAARTEAAQRGAELLEEARTRLDRLTTEMREELEHERDEIMVRHHEEILDTVLHLASNVVQAVTTRRTHDDLVTNFCASIYQMPQDQVEQYRRLMAGRVPTAFVTTPVPLNPEQTRTVSDTLSSLANRRVELQVTIDPGLIAGLQVRVADALIDNSIHQQLSRLRERVRNEVVARAGASG